MRITNIIIDSYTPQETGICAEFTIELDDALCIHKIYVINGKNGLFIAFPNTRETKEVANKVRYFDIVHPTNNAVRNQISESVLKAYEDYALEHSM